jgi:RES domain-containing protein
VGFAYETLPTAVYRVSFTNDPLAFIPSHIYRLAVNGPTRWQPIDYSYRVLYTSATLPCAFAEVLQDILASPAASAVLGAVTIDDPADATLVPTRRDAVDDFLKDRFIARLECSGPAIVRVDATQTLAALAVAVTPTPTNTELFAPVSSTTQKVSAYLYKLGEDGIAMPSVIDRVTLNYAFFERAMAWSRSLRVVWRVRARMRPHEIREAIKLLAT